MRLSIFYTYIIILSNLITTAYATISDNPSEQLFVSLGSHCEVAANIRHNTLRMQAFPFDWIGTSHHEKFLELLDNDFAFFLDESVMFQYPENLPTFNNTYYGIRFRHENPSDPTISFTQYLTEISAKYEPRIKRFRELKNFLGKVFFIRAALDSQDYLSIISKEQQKTLRAALDRFFSPLNFTLVIINYSEENKYKELELQDGIIEFKIRRNHKNIDYIRLINTISKKRHAF